MSANALTPRRVAAAAALALVACRASATAPPEEVVSARRPAVLAFYGDPVRVTAPDTVAVGAPLAVAVTTYGGGCVAQGDTEVAVAALAADVRPYDHFVTRLPAGGACTAALHLYRHEAVVQFARAGRAVLRVHGRAEPGDRPVTVERVVVVR